MTSLIVLTTTPWFVSAANNGDDVTFGGGGLEMTYFVAVLVIAALVGFLLRGGAIAVLVLCVVPLIPLGVNPQDNDGWTYWGLQVWGLMLLVTPAAILGIVVRLVRDGASAAKRGRAEAKT